MKQTIRLYVSGESPSVEEVNAALLREELKLLSGLSLPRKPNEEGELRNRFTGLEVLAAFATSAAATTLAQAVRDIVNRQKIKITLVEENGRSFSVEASSKDTASIADLVGFLTSQYKKTALVVSPAQKTSRQAGSKKLSSASKKVVKKLPSKVSGNLQDDPHNK